MEGTAACWNCGDAAQDHLCCSKCRRGRFCSKACLDEAWPVHKATCREPLTADCRAGLAVVTLDLRRVRPEDCAGETEAPFISMLLMITASSASELSMQPLMCSPHRENNSDQVLGMIAHSVRDWDTEEALRALFSIPKAMGAGNMDLMCMPAGMAWAALDCYNRLERGVRAWPARLELMERMGWIFEWCKPADPPFKGSTRNSTPELNDCSREEAAYAADYRKGVEEPKAYNSALLPCGAVISVYHFCNGRLFRRLDVVACIKGLFVDRIVQIHPMPLAIDCKALRKVADALSSGEVELQVHAVDPTQGAKVIQKMFNKVQGKGGVACNVQVCMSCGRTAEQAGLARLQLCAGCTLRRPLCGPECQKKYWPIHKHECRANKRPGIDGARN